VGTAISQVDCPFAKSESKTFKNFREQGGFHTTNALYIKRTPKIKRKQSFLSTMQN
jgi:hypothetical protein